MNGTDVTGPCAAVQNGLIMMMCGSQKMEFLHDRKPIGQNAELWTVWFGYWKTKTEQSHGFLQTLHVHTYLTTFIIYIYTAQRPARAVARYQKDTAC